MGKTKGAIDWRWRILAKILQEKVVTESDLIEMLHYCKHKTIILNDSYKHFVRCGLPIRRKTLNAKWNRKGGSGRQYNHRVVVYYVE